VTQYDFPRPLLLTGTNLLSTQTVACAWSSRAVDAWVLRARERLEHLRLLVG
jgi:hypothetical protein